MGQLGIRIINIVLFTTSCFFTASVVNHVADSQLAPDYVSAFQPVARSEPKKPTRQERKAILERNLFGAKLESSAKPPPPPPEPEKEEEEIIPLSQLPLSLAGTVEGKPASLSLAVIQNSRNKKHQVVQVGDVLDDFDKVTVQSIEAGKVRLNNRGITEELLLIKIKKNNRMGAAAMRRNAKASRKGVRGKRGRRDRASKRASRAAPKPVENEEEEEEEEAKLRRMEVSLSQSLGQDLEPARGDDGSIEGVLVRNADPKGLLAQAGLEADDVITSLNGITIDSAGAAARVLRELAKCQPMTGSVRGSEGERPLEISQALLSELNCTN